MPKWHSHHGGLRDKERQELETCLTQMEDANFKHYQEVVDKMGSAIQPTLIDARILL